MSKSAPAIVWFRNDLRLGDNPALHAAVSSGRPVVCLYVLEADPALRPLGEAGKWWLDKSLAGLAKDIEARGGQLTLRRGAPADCLNEVIEQVGAGAVFWNRRYDGGGRQVDEAIKSDLKSRGLAAQSYNGTLLNEPWAFETSAGGYYRVFTPYWKAVWDAYEAPGRLGTPSDLSGPTATSEQLADWNLHPSDPDWSEGFDDPWVPGEDGAEARLADFLAGPISQYGERRNRPDIVESTSGLSPHLRWGEISPAEIWRRVRTGMARGEIDTRSAKKFLSELVWREFAYVLLFHNPELAEENYNPDYRHMPWRDSPGDYERWTRGRTGYPIVDAGMRQLWHTGWMHNRVRMITASFLTKHLLVPWQRGEDWFWDTLVDADPASNSASWQWVAGSGADAAPYFRVFNPITQGEKFDETGGYVRRWCPELEALPDKYLHAPWTAPASLLDEAGIRLGDTYPEPMIDHAEGRKRALAAYDELKERRSTQ